MSFQSEQYIRQCFELAKLARGKTSPNPMVGAVIVKNGRVLATGFHRKAGSDHAELDAIKNATESLEGATLYCNLEPCSHLNKRTPPCTQRIIQEKFAHVVIANVDPNPAVNGHGIELLKQAGITVETGILANEGEELNEIFFKNMRTQKPFVHLKIAQTIDGRIATNSGDSQWITNEFSRQAVHQLRSEYDAILIGAETLRRDNPQLTIRLGDEISSPVRLVLSQSGDLPYESKIFQDEFSYKTIVVVPEDVVNKKRELFTKLEKKSVQVLALGSDSKSIDLNNLLDVLYANSIRSVLVEGGSEIFTHFINQKLYDRISFFIAPKILGDGINAVGNLNHDKMYQSIELTQIKTKQYFDDILFTGKRSENVHRFN
ncbi:MAG: bifunctional diaminohydroxyphosphoribosylaminopyrimidine deaminase/5-amino-6-(5-phosphoribosylamino)uracil reductase RibD [Bacteriovoracaceae bacterium]|nr:bifunctional diaminohydroxyphosphoribosylaminopyrimidine deaminase/5-amino-6-(5-phosphoribosylamino)uracil reductase RibD [Bacteriovoracaceae bacterium]